MEFDLLTLSMLSTHVFEDHGKLLLRNVVWSQ